MDFDNVLPGFVVIIYILIEIIKRLFLKTSESRKHIPLIAGILGVIAAIITFYIAPEMLYCNNLLEAIAVGGMSGFAATGCNQLYNKYIKYKSEKITDTDIQ